MTTGSAAAGHAEQTTRADEAATLLQRLQQAGVEQLRLAWADLHGTLRGKTVVGGAEAFAEALRDGVGMVSTLLLKDTSDRTAFAVFDATGQQAMRQVLGLERFAAAGNVQLMPDCGSLQMLPWAPATAWLRCDPVWPDGAAVQADPRSVLLRALAALQAAGYGLRCGLEIEFHIHRIEGDHHSPAAAGWPANAPAVSLLHPGYALLSEAWADGAHEALSLVQRTAQGLGLPLRSLEIEFGPSQFEAVFAPTDALQAADQMILFRNGVRQALRRAGYHVSFACKPPLPHAVASGWHLHQSLVGADGGNAMRREHALGDAAEARHTLSDAGTHWLAGLLAHAPALAALSAPTVSAYARYQGSVMAPQSAVWGRDNRGAMLRVMGGAGSNAARIENRLGEPMANPYLVMAAQVWAGLDGLQRRLEPGLATETPYAEGPLRLPVSLTAALDALAADEVLQAGLGPAMVCVFDTVKRQEVARHAQSEDAEQWVSREYFGRF